MAESKDESHISIPGVITTALTIAGFAFLYLTQRQALSIGEQVLFGSIISVSAVAFFVWIWYRPIAHYWAERRSAGREDRISRKSLGTFQSYVERLRTICSVQRMDSIVYHLQNLKAQSEFSKLPELNPWIFYVDSLTFQVTGLLNRMRVDRYIFTWAVDTFSLVLRLFNDNLNRIVNEARLIAEQKPIPRNLKEDYNTYRQTYIRFLEDYSSFVDELNKQFRTYEVTYSGGQGSYTETAFRPVYAERPKEL